MYFARAAGLARAKASRDSRLLRGLQACLPHTADREVTRSPAPGPIPVTVRIRKPASPPPLTHTHTPVDCSRSCLAAPGGSVIRSASREGYAPLAARGGGGRGCIDPEPAFGDEDTAHSELRWASRRLRRFLRSARCCAALAAAAARLRRGFAAAAGLRAAAAELHAPRRRAAVAAPPRRIRRVSSVHA